MHQTPLFSGYGKEVSPAFLDDGRRITTRFAGLTLSTVFQPLFRHGADAPPAHEALLRVVEPDGSPLAPLEAFARLNRLGHAVEFDRLCRLLHVLNFVRQSDGDHSLFLNVNGAHVLGLIAGEHGSFIGTLLTRHGLDPARVVLEIVEDRIDDLARLEAAVHGYRLRGLRIAIDDFGARHSNFDRLWMLNPDVVKLDRTLIVQATANPQARRVLPRLIEIIHELGAEVVCEGIETAEQHAIALDAGADLLQGFLLAPPAERLFLASPA